MIKRFISCIAIIALAAVFAFGTTVIVPSDDDLIVGSRLIIRGKVVAQETRQDNPNMAVFTYTTLEVAEVYKGQLSTSTITIKEVGGCFNNNCSILFGVPEYSTNEEVILFLDTWPDGSLRTYQWFLGKYKVSAENGSFFVSRDLGLSKVNILNISDVNAQKEDILQFTNKLASKIRTLKSRSDEHSARYFRGNSVQTKPLELNNPIPNFTFLNPNTPMRWFEPDTNQPVNFRVNPQGMPASFTISHLNQSLAAWSTVPNSGLRLSNGGNTSGCGLLTLDGENTISFNNCDNYSPFSPPSGGCSGILAAAGIIQYSPFQTRVVNQITFYRAIEANVSFNPYASCHFGNTCNVQEIMAHELGHAGIGLNHSLDGDATMAPFAHFDGRCAGLRADDMAGCRFMYPSSGTIPPTPTPTPNNLVAKRSDFDSDNKADQVVWNGNSSYWHVLNSSNNTVSTYYWGTNQPPFRDFPVVMDLNNDKRYDVTVFRNLNGYWHTFLSSGGQLHTIFGRSGDIPVPSHWDLDKKTDLGYYRESTGDWSLLLTSNNSVKSFQLGGLGWQPVVLDVDGDGISDPCVFSNGHWRYLSSREDTFRDVFFGNYGDTPVAEDYEGLGSYNFAVWTGLTGEWKILKNDGQIYSKFWGGSQYSDVPQPRDFVGNDNRADICVYRKNLGHWYIVDSTIGIVSTKVLGGTDFLPLSFR